MGFRKTNIIFLNLKKIIIKISFMEINFTENFICSNQIE